jgi:hypothetical protein
MLASADSIGVLAPAPLFHPASLPAMERRHSGRPLVFRATALPVGNRFPPRRSAKASAPSGLAKQNTTLRWHRHVMWPSALEIVAGGVAPTAGHRRIIISFVAGVGAKLWLPASLTRQANAGRSSGSSWGRAVNF